MKKNNYIFADFEYTCGKGIPENEREIIQFCIVVCHDEKLANYETKTDYVIPVIHPNLTDFCKELTGIDQLSVSPCASAGITQEAAINYLYKMANAYETDIYVFGDCDKRVIRLCEDRLIKEGKDIKRVSDKIVNIQGAIGAAVGRGGMSPRSLSYYANAYGLSTTGVHNAKVDAKLLMQVFKKTIIDDIDVPNKILVDIISEYGETIKQLSSKVNALENSMGNYSKTKKKT